MFKGFHVHASLVWAGSDGQIVVYGTTEFDEYEHSFVYSQDDGLTWASVSAPPSVSGMWGSADGPLYVSLREGPHLMRSFDGADTWEPLYIQDEDIRGCFGVTGHGASHVLTTCTGGIVARSDDQGITWSTAHATRGEGAGVLRAFGPHEVLLGSGLDVYRSTDGGVSFRSLDYPEPTAGAGVTTVWSDGSLIVAGDWRAARYTSDAGENWLEFQPRSQSPEASPTWGLAALHGSHRGELVAFPMHGVDQGLDTHQALPQWILQRSDSMEPDTGHQMELRSLAVGSAIGGASWLAPDRTLYGIYAGFISRVSFDQMFSTASSATSEEK